MQGSCFATADVGVETRGSVVRMRAAMASMSAWRSAPQLRVRRGCCPWAFDPASVGTSAEAAVQLAVAAERAQHICLVHPVPLRAPAEPWRSAATLLGGAAKA